MNEVFSNLQLAAENLDNVSKIVSRGDQMNLNSRMTWLLSLIEEACTLDRNAALANLFVPQPSVWPTTRHNVAVAVICELMGRRLLSKVSERRALVSAALTMNISVVNLQKKLYLSHGELTNKERQQMKVHPLRDVTFLKASGIVDPLWLHAIVNHHETMNGQGYPRKVPVEKISVLSRILMIVDIYVERMLPRGTRSGLKSHQVVRELFVQHVAKIDKTLAAAFIGEVGIYPPGVQVKLEDGRSGVVVKAGKSAKSPCIRLMNIQNPKKIEDVEAIPVNVLPITRVPSTIDIREMFTYHEAEKAQSTTAKISEPKIERLSENTDFWTIDEDHLMRVRTQLHGVRIPNIPPLLIKIQGLLRHDIIDIKGIGQLVEQDVELSGLLLKVINSPAYALPTRIHDEVHALNYLGIKRFEQFLLTAALKNALSKVQPNRMYFIRLWTESVAVAECARQLAVMLKMDEELAYLGGLFQSSGQLLMAAKFPDYIDRLLKESVINPVSILDKEQEAYLVTHSETGYLLADGWQLPDAVREAIYMHHNTDYKSIVDNDVRTLTAIIAVSVSLVEQVLFLHDGNSEECQQYMGNSLKELGMVSQDIQGLKGDVAKLISLELDYTG
jgi:HD-GYP domain-containing protein (c-di-GMP phosphodiesterase class II)